MTLFQRKENWAEMRALKNTLKAGVNMRTAAMTRGAIMNLYNKMGGNFAKVAGTGNAGKEAANLMNRAQKIIYG